ncbi:hypothetical protein [Ekhidna sp.]
MRSIRTFILLTLLGLTNVSIGQQEFLNELGTEKAESFRKLIDSYQRFLSLNYPNASSLGEQTRSFMMQMVNGEKPLNYDSLDAINVISSLEQSGLRKEIYLYNEEEYEGNYELREFLSEVEADEIDESIAFDNREIIVNDSLKKKWDAIFQERFEQLSPEQKKIEEELEKRRKERKIWGSTPTPKGLFHYTLLKTDTSFYAYCLIRSMDNSPAITPALTELSNDELELWNIQIIFMIDYYLRDILFRYRRHMKPATNKR